MTEFSPAESHKLKCLFRWHLSWVHIYRVWERVWFQAHLGCWQNSIPCSCRTEVSFSCWLSFDIYSLLLEATTFLLTWLPSNLKGSDRAVSPSHTSSLTSDSATSLRKSPSSKTHWENLPMFLVNWNVTLITPARSLLPCKKAITGVTLAAYGPGGHLEFCLLQRSWQCCTA